MVRILKSIPIVVMKDGVKESSLKRRRQHDLPTPESPISRSLIYTAEMKSVHILAICYVIISRRVLRHASVLKRARPYEADAWEVGGRRGGWMRECVRGSHSCDYSTWQAK